MSDSELRRARDLGAATYLSAYVNLMTRALGMVTVDLDADSVNAIALDMVPSINLATEAAWCATMKDRNGMEAALKRLHTSLEKL